MANQIPLKVMKDGSNNTCGLAQFTSSDSVAIAAGGTGLTSQGSLGKLEFNISGNHQGPRKF